MYGINSGNAATHAGRSNAAGFESTKGTLQVGGLCHDYNHYHHGKAGKQYSFHN
jgi:hypothetical protein